MKKLKIALCPGHKHSAKGAVNKKYNLNEYDEGSIIVEHMATQLRDLGHNVTVIDGGLTHKVDTINSGGFDLAIDYHHNADADHLDPNDYDDTRGTGSMVMYCPKAKTYGEPEPGSTRRSQANTVSASIASSLGIRDLKGRPGWYWGQNSLSNGKPTKKDYFLRKTTCPSLILEPGYIDNNKFAKTWLVSKRHEELATAAVKALLEAFG